MKTPQLSQGGASEFIRAAERSIAAGDLNLALQQIANARSIDPQNEYLDAIVERIELLASRQAPAAKGGFFQTPPAPVARRDQPPDTKELQARVKRLTNVAINLFERGSYEIAFDSLMKAYLLDPTSTYVMNCEKTLLPAIELMRKRGTIASAAQQAPQQKAASLAPAPGLAGSDPAGLEALRHDAQPTIQPEARKIDPPKNDPGQSGTSSRQAGGFFTRLRGGKLLG